MSRLFGIILVIAFILPFFPIASAAAPIPPTLYELEEEIWSQPYADLNVIASSTVEAMAIPSAGTYYTVVSQGFTGGCSDTAFGTLVDQSNSTQLLWVHFDKAFTSRADITNVQLMKHVTSGNKFYAVVKFTTPYAINSVKVGGGVTACSPATLGPIAFAPLNGLMGRVSSSMTTSLVHHVGVVLKSYTSLGSETGVVQSIDSLGVTEDDFTWTRLNSPQTVVSWSGSGSFANYNVQSYTVPSSEYTTYLETLKLNLRAGVTGTCDKMTVAISDTLSFPWNKSKELANATFSTTWTSGSTPTITINFLSGTVSYVGSSFSLTNVAFSKAGVSVSGTGLVTLPPEQIPDATYYIKVHSLQNNEAACSQGVDFSSSNLYSGGTMYSPSGSSWDPMTGDFAVVQVGTYGGAGATYYQNVTQTSVGGAQYAFIKETIANHNTAGALKLVTSYGGNSVHTGTYHATNAFNVDAYRLGYLKIPVNGTAAYTVVADYSAAERNIFYSGVPKVQPDRIATTLYSSGAGLSSINIATLLTSDDYYTSVTMKIYECKTPTCVEFGTVPLDGVAYTVQIGSRSVTGTTNETGELTIEGQDLRSKTLTVVLSKTGYEITEWSVATSTAASYSFVFGIIKSQVKTGVPALLTGTVSISPNPGNFTVPNPAIFFINKTDDKIVYWTVFKLEASGLPSARTKSYPITTAQDIAKFPLSGVTTNASGITNSTGQYYIAVTDFYGQPLKIAPFVICASPTSCPGMPALSSAVNQTIMESAGTSIQIQKQNAPIVQTIEDSRSRLQKTLDWSFDAPFMIPNMWLIALVGITGMLAIRARGFGGGGDEL